MTHKNDRVLSVKELARVEGEGALYLRASGNRVEEARLDIYEPPRFFEAFLRGRAYTEPPDITARICGICPVAYQMSACLAVEEACGVTVEGPIADLRRLLYCGEWIESHALHIYLLHAPDFLGYRSGIEMATARRDIVERGLALKKAGNAIMEVVGGRPIHPVNVRLGGFYRAPTRAELAVLTEPLRRALDGAVATAAWVAGFDFPDHAVQADMLALWESGTYPIERGTVRTRSGLAFPAAGWDEHVIEEQVPHSTALHAHLADGGRYLTGPLARYSLSSRWLSPLAREAARAAGLGPTCDNPFRSIIVRAVETVYAIEEALRLIAAYEPPDPPAVKVRPRAGVGCGVTEAPRGTLYHRYEIGADGLIRTARIVPPTSQNQAAIEADLRVFAEPRLGLDDAELTRQCEQAIRNYDPCISCSAHFLDLTVERSLFSERTVVPVRAPGRQPVVVIGLGNEFRHDDGVGLAVVDRLRDLVPPGVELVITDGEPTRLIEAWTGAALAVVVDAVRAQPPRPGRIHRFVLDRPGAGAGRPASSHGFGLDDAIALALALDRMPGRLTVHAIEAADLTQGTGLTPAVAAAVDLAATAILDDLAASRIILKPGRGDSGLVLVLNSGSSSVKFALLDPGSGQRMLDGMAEKVGTTGAVLHLQREGGDPVTEQLDDSSYQAVISRILGRLPSSGPGLAGVGHRVVHGGARFAASVLVDDGVIAAIRSVSPLAPLHNPANLAGIEAVRAARPDLPQVAAFDTAFHQTMPPAVFRYAVPEEWYTRYGVRRYGFHGTSHRFVSEQAAALLGRPLGELRLVTAHLGNGCSLAAVRDGASVDTTMGLTPLEGLVMGTRSGDVDPGMFGYLADQAGLTVGELTRTLNSASGLAGLSGVGNDMRAVEAAAGAGDARARLALEVFVYRLAKAVAGMVVGLERLDALVFAGGIGENSAEIRSRVLARLAFLGLAEDPETNAQHGRATGGRISPDGPVLALVVPTDEEMMIARDTARLIAASEGTRR
jgi:sulfhydrogenase subunit alpha